MPQKILYKILTKNDIKILWNWEVFSLRKNDSFSVVWRHMSSWIYKKAPCKYNSCLVKLTRCIFWTNYQNHRNFCILIFKWQSFIKYSSSYKVHSNFVKKVTMSVNFSNNPLLLSWLHCAFLSPVEKKKCRSFVYCIYRQ